MNYRERLEEYLQILRDGNVTLLRALPISNDDVKRLIVINWLEQLFDSKV